MPLKAARLIAAVVFYIRFAGGHWPGDKSHTFGDRTMDEQAATLEVILDLDARQEELLRQLEELDRRVQQVLRQLAEASRTEQPES